MNNNKNEWMRMKNGKIWMKSLDKISSPPMFDGLEQTLI